MAKRDFKSSPTMLNPSDQPAPLLRASLDTLRFGFAIFDRDLKLVASNKAFRTLRGYPAALCKPGTEIIEFYRFNAERGDYGPGDVEAQARERLDRVRARQPHEDPAGSAGRVIRQEQDGLLLIIDKKKLTEKGRADAIRVLQEAVGRLTD